MKVLVTGRGTSGSWQIRGAQLGMAIGATVEPNAEDVAGYDLAIIVKRPRTELVRRLQAASVPIVWDVVDAWPQPIGNDWERSACMGWLRGEVKTIKPRAIVAATEAMAVDCDFSLPVIALPHHARPGQNVNPIREQVQAVGYEGGEQYLGSWRPWLERECARRGWRFVVNPRQLADVDIVVAVREKQGYAPRNWKSNVKLANAQGSGTPCVMNREAGYMENSSGGEVWADTQDEMAKAFDVLTRQDWRRDRAERLLHRAPSLEKIAKKYLRWLHFLPRY